MSTMQSPQQADTDTLRRIQSLAATRDHRLGTDQRGSRPLSAAAAAKILAYLEGRPARQEQAAPGLMDRAAARVNPPRPAADGRPQRVPREDQVTEAGIYRHGGTVYKVVIAQYGSGKGRPYAKRFDTDAKKFVMASGMMSYLRADERMSVEEAGEFGALYGVCTKCEQPLTDEISIGRGYGPVCWGKVSATA